MDGVEEKKEVKEKKQTPQYNKKQTKHQNQTNYQNQSITHESGGKIRMVMSGRKEGWSERPEKYRRKLRVKGENKL